MAQFLNHRDKNEKKSQSDSFFLFGGEMKTIRWFLFSATLTLAVSAFAQFYGYTFGYPGRDGQSGFSGSGGRDGQNLSVVAKGQTEYFDLRGEDGSPGSDGSYGEDASSCWHSRPNHDVRGADGGNSGDGGSGGSGGDGGSVTVYYDNPSHLKSISVDSTPGRGQRGGEAGRYAGRGCRCDYSSWVNRICETKYQYVTVCRPLGCSAGTEGCVCRQEKQAYTQCYDRRFFCHEGRDGRYGSSGRQGSDGSLGSARLIPRLTELEPTTPSMNILVNQVLDGPFTLDRHDWAQKSGALSLFGPGSRLSDRYSQWVGKTVRTLSFDWKESRRPPSHFGGSSVQMDLQGSDVRVSISPDVWYVGSETVNGAHKTFVVQNALRSSEVAALKIVEVEGRLENLNLVFEDTADVSDLVKTRILVKSDWDLEAGGDFEGYVPDELISRVGNRILVNFGRLPGIKSKKVSKYFGEDFEVKLKVERLFAGRMKLVQEAAPVFELDKDLKKNKALEVQMRKDF